MFRVIVTIILMALVVFPAKANDVIYRFAKIIDGTGSVLDARDILISDGLIKQVGMGVDKTAPDASLVDMGSLIALPGLIDAHTHITYGLEGESHGNAWAELGQVPLSKRLVAGYENGLKTLNTGVTTVRDLNAGENLDYYLRDLINAGALKGPRIFTSGAGIHPANEGNRVTEARDRTAEVLALASTRAREGADWIKFFATTGSASDLTSRQQYFEDDFKAAVSVAKQFGLRVTVHSYGPEAVEGAINAGVNSIEHAVDVPDALLERMAETGIIYVPTVDHNRYYAAHADEYGYGDDIQKNLYDFVARNLETVKRAHKRGVKIAMGSDAVLSGFGENTCELRAFVEAGMTNSEAIQTATINGAALLGQEDRLGRIKAGFVADIVAVEADPLVDINNLINGVRWVLKEGKIVVPHNNQQRQQPNCGALKH
ncbi:amidohydrolase family protein [Kordiimonas sp. SCSIO 12610]|uniref:amidohydrolase family protein n=1 Tax=Kordiimonas sp. SCSIO 12610 TaxID=2829597 RepID=UPI00210C8215|nr:amidohydrolase family protein [Kordiimonas sp. SCSIO 12610]UTW55921.1 amidohydrolase family protein [Kordiimonas sp. SCSIO 12610]